MAEHLSTYVLVRRVDRSGLVSLYNRGHYVGKIHKGKHVYVMYDPDLNEWFFSRPSKAGSCAVSRPTN